MGMIAASLSSCCVQAASPEIGVARVVGHAGDGFAQPMIAGPAKAHAAGLARLIGDRHDASLGGESVIAGESLTDITQFGQDLSGADVSGPREGHDDLSVGKRFDETLDAMSQSGDLFDQGCQDVDQREHHVGHGLGRQCRGHAARGGLQSPEEFGRAAAAAVVLGTTEALQARFVQAGGRSWRWIAFEERQADGRVHGCKDAGAARPEGVECGVQLIGQSDASGHQIIASAHQGTQSADGVRLWGQRGPAMSIGAQQIGKQISIRGVALGAVTAVTRTAGLDGIGMDRKDLMSGLDQRIDDQARGTLDGDAQVRAVAGKAVCQRSQAIVVVADLEAFQDLAGGVDDAHRMRLRGPVQSAKDLSTHRQTPWSCGMTARVGRPGGELIDWRSGGEGLALHPVARHGLPAPHGLQVSYGPSRGQRRRQSPWGHGSQFLPSVHLLVDVNKQEVAQ